MKVDLSKPVLDLEGNQIMDNGTPLTMMLLFRTALIGEFDDKKTSEEKFGDFKIALKLKNEVVDLELDEITRVKKLIGKIPSTVLVGRAIEFIEKIGKDD